MKRLLAPLIALLFITTINAQSKNDFILEFPTLVGVTYQRSVLKHVKVFYNINFDLFNYSDPASSGVGVIGVNYPGSAVNSVFSQVGNNQIPSIAANNIYINELRFLNEHNFGLYLNFDSLLRNQRLDVMFGPFINMTFVDLTATGMSWTTTNLATNERFYAVEYNSYRGWLHPSFGAQISIMYRISGSLYGGLRFGLFDLYDTSFYRESFSFLRLQLGVKF